VHSTAAREEEHQQRFWATSECRINRASIVDMSGGASDGIDVNQSPNFALSGFMIPGGFDGVS
jgi:hypothetical protein